MNVVYTGEKAPPTFNQSLFLAGPTPRSAKVSSWRPDALKILEAKRYDGVVFVPEPRGGVGAVWPEYDQQVAWEHAVLNMSDCVLFWVPRHMKKLPAFTTNIEFGDWMRSGKAVFGAPPRSPKNDYLRFCAKKFHMPTAVTLEGTIDAALKLIGEGSHRSAGARNIPLMLWNTKSFQSWYQAQKRVCNELLSARVEWTKRVGKDHDKVFAWAIQPEIRIHSEGRDKTNDPVVSRSDISAVLLYKKAADILDTTIVLSREFRSPAANDDCMIWETPSGSSPNPKLTWAEIAREEVHEELGLALDPVRIRFHEARQLMSTLSAHKAHLFSAELTNEELLWLQNQKGVAKGSDLGVNPTGERVYTEALSLREVMEKQLVDWSTLGMIFKVLTHA